MRHEPAYHGGFLEKYYLERYLCGYTCVLVITPYLSLSPEDPSINWVSSPTVSPHARPPGMAIGGACFPQRGWFVAQSRGGMRTWQIHLSCCTHDPAAPAQEPSRCQTLNRSSSGSRQSLLPCNLCLHLVILLGIKFRILNAWEETKRQLLFITIGLAGVSVCHVA